MWPDFSAKVRIFCKEPTWIYAEDGDHGFAVSSTKDERNIVFGSVLNCNLNEVETNPSLHKMKRWRTSSSREFGTPASCAKYVSWESGSGCFSFLRRIQDLSWKQNSFSLIVWNSITYQFISLLRRFLLHLLTVTILNSAKNRSLASPWVLVPESKVYCIIETRLANKHGGWLHSIKWWIVPSPFSIYREPMKYLSTATKSIKLEGWIAQHGIIWARTQWSYWVWHRFASFAIRIVVDHFQEISPSTRWSLYVKLSVQEVARPHFYKSRSCAMGEHHPDKC